MSNPIPSPQAPFVGLAQLITREWYRFLVNLAGTTTYVTLDFPNTLAGECSDLTVNVPDAKDGDVVSLGVGAASVPANGSFFAWVSATGVVTIRYTNNDLVTAYDPAEGVFRVVTRRFLT